MRGWLDINPRQWFYRSVLESERIYLDAHKDNSLFNSLPYNVFEEGKERRVEVFTSEEGQKEFEIEGFTPDSRMEVNIYIEGSYVAPSKLETGKIHLPNPIGGLQEVVIVITGVPRLQTLPCVPGEPCEEGGECRQIPYITSCDGENLYPSADLSMKDHYEFDLYYGVNEQAISLSRVLKRINVTVMEGETVNEALRREIGYKRDVYTIIDGTIYVSYDLNDIPVYVNYNFNSEEDGGIVKNMQGERVIPHSDCPLYNDRFFPNLRMTRAEFFSLLQRIRENLYNRYTDRGYVPNPVQGTERYIADKEDILGKWYDVEVLNILDEVFSDGCYVFPLYEDETFVADGCVTRAEVAVYIHRFVEWALERFR